MQPLCGLTPFALLLISSDFVLMNQEEQREFL